MPEFKDLINALHHYSGSQDMFILLATAVYWIIQSVWKEPACALWFWNSYVKDPWGNWCLCMVEMAGTAIDTVHMVCIHMRYTIFMIYTVFIVYTTYVMYFIRLLIKIRTHLNPHFYAHTCFAF